MAYNSAFSPFGSTYLVGTSAIQVKSSNNVYPSSYRIINLTSSLIRVGWAPQEPSDATVTPVATSPTAAGIANVLTLPANGVGVFSGIPPNAWFIASAASVEITPGEGIN
ncbi:hypothetical protein UFOVP620_57 [uncultured Caudovirales phage]|uniref:Uncharacterized protein n=1 Tax=uncultured Caudovirales phage TaxID=2100421 RepID=A0A6J5N760_9CAUD|nr:hypothetical protein UFOVP620_57 [uncultured Caudovirales phage]